MQSSEKPLTAGDETLSELFAEARTGDVFFMNRNCWAMRDPLAMGLCLLTKTENRFDHVGMLVKVHQEDLERFPETKRHIIDYSPSSTYVLETNMKGITLYAAEQRVQRTSANELAVRSVDIKEPTSSDHDDWSTRVDSANAEENKLNHKMLHALETMYDTPYQEDIRAIAPSIFSPPDKMDRIDAAHKINRLQLEVNALTTDLRDGGASMSEEVAQAYKDLLAVYRESQVLLLDAYFPHLQRQSATDAKWDEGHYTMDGRNHSAAMVCTELIANLWLKTGITNGYAPASSMRVFDFMDDTRFNFTGPDMKLGDLRLLKSGKRTGPSLSSRELADSTEVDDGRRGRAQRAGKDPAPTDRHLRFHNAIRAEAGLHPVASITQALPADGRQQLPQRWLVQSNDQDCVRHVGARLFAAGIVFACWSFPCAPLTLRWWECQAGLFLMRGSVWSLASGVFARNVAFAAVQGLIAAGLSTALAAPRGSTALGVMRSPFHAPPPADDGRGGKPGFVDWRHPYYTVSGIFAVSTVLAHVATQPFLNMTLSHHFGPARAGPLPWRTLFRGAFVLAPFSLLVPMSGYFLGWYELAGSFVIPTRSSVLRFREDLLQRSDWPHYRTDALIGAAGATLLADATLYPAQMLVTRSLMRSLYQPQPSPSIGRKLFAGYRYRFAGNVFVFGASYATLRFALGMM